MKKLNILFLALILIFYTSCLFADPAADDQNKDTNPGLYPGMEETTVSDGVRVIMPKGSITHRLNPSLTVLESTDEYAARKFSDAESRLLKLEEEIKVVKEQLAQLKDSVDEIREKYEGTEKK